MKKGAIGKIYDIKVHEILIILGGGQIFLFVHGDKILLPPELLFE